MSRPTIGVPVDGEVAKADMIKHPDSVYHYAGAPLYRYRYHNGRFQFKMLSLDTEWGLDRATIFDSGSTWGEKFVRVNTALPLPAGAVRKPRPRPAPGEAVSLKVAKSDMEANPGTVYVRTDDASIQYRFFTNGKHQVRFSFMDWHDGGDIGRGHDFDQTYIRAPEAPPKPAAWKLDPPPARPLAAAEKAHVGPKTLGPAAIKGAVEVVKNIAVGNQQGPGADNVRQAIDELVELVSQSYEAIIEQRVKDALDLQKDKLSKQETSNTAEARRLREVAFTLASYEGKVDDHALEVAALDKLRICLTDAVNQCDAELLARREPPMPDEVEEPYSI